MIGKYEVDEDGKTAYPCPKCLAGRLRWVQSGQFACRNEACAITMTAFHTEGCHIADWDYLIGSDGQIYCDWDGAGPEPCTGSYDPTYELDCAERMRKAGVSEDLISRFLKTYRNPFRNVESEE